MKERKITMKYAEELGMKAKYAEKAIATASAQKKNNALKAIADALLDSTGEIMEKNKIDLKNAEDNNMSKAMLDRLTLNEKRIDDMVCSIHKLIEMEEIIGSVDCGVVRPNGLRILKTRVPLGAIGIIYESRPNVTVDAAVLCLKAGNAVILRGGKEAINSNKCLAGIMRRTAEKSGFPADIIQLVEDTSRETARDLMHLNEYLDVLIPRGGGGLINTVIKEATVPVIETGVGNCHVYVDKTADIEMAVSVVHNSKTSRPSVCNAAEGLLVHCDIADELLPKIAEAFKSHSVEIRGCRRTAEILKDIKPASDDDFAKEYGDYIISVKVVDSIDEAVVHINKYSTD